MKTNYLGLSETVEEFISHLFQALFPAYFGEYEENFDAGKKTERETALAHAALKKAVSYVFINTSDGSYENADKFVSQFIENIPAVRAFVETDMVAAYEGDPAAKSIDEVILSYPAFRAITIYRFAHELYLMNVPR